MKKKTCLLGGALLHFYPPCIALRRCREIDSLVKKNPCSVKDLERSEEAEDPQRVPIQELRRPALLCNGATVPIGFNGFANCGRVPVLHHL
jgi:hypothetical protein